MTVPDRLARALALWFGCGLVPYAPGTAGTLGAIPLYLLVRPYGLGVVLATAVGLTAVGIWAAGRVAVHTGTHDPQIVVIDEVAGVFVTWLAAPDSAAGLVTGVVLFRVFDIGKPWPARRAERLAGGWGIVLDDLAAGAWGAALLLGARALGWL
ncbi:MAG: phosphatidylglycerophosphatase A [Polyangiaceae bacterium]|nr:phosphatidylglycerophosphatase A [Polyangiaceae bacterium]